MLAYKKKKGIGTFSELVRKGFEILEKVFPLESLETEASSLYAKLENIEKELKELRVQKELLQKQEITTNEQIILIQDQDKKLEEDLNELPLEKIPNSNEISKKVFALFKEFNTSKIRDFVLMGELRKYYKDSFVWATLVKLKENKKLKIENGEWKLYNA